MFGKKTSKELPPPADAMQNPAAQEIIRAWIVDKGLSVSLKTGFDSPSTWGILLVDLARHAARAYAMDGVCSEEEAMNQIRQLWTAELRDPTDLGVTKQVQ